MTKNLCVLRGYLYLPLKAFSQTEIDNFKQSLTYTAPYPDDDGVYKSYTLYDLTETTIGFPQEWVKENYPNLTALATDARVATPDVLKAIRLPDPKHPRVKNPEAQAEFMDELLSAVQTHENVLASAATGSGKTVVALRTAAILGYRTLILVHTEQLRDQWINEIQDKLGLSRDDIGILQRDKCQIDKPIVVGLLQTQKRREYADEVYDAFGLVIVDECHKLATEYFSDVLPKFNAKYRICLSATPNRKDGQDIVLRVHVGPVRVQARTEIMPIKVYPKKYYAKRKLWGKDERTRISCIIKDQDRNQIIADDLVHLYKNGRRILIVSHSVDHLEKLMSMCAELGIAQHDMGLLTASRAKYDRTHTWKVIGKRKSTKQEQEDAKKTRLCFMIDQFKEGIDVPAWDFLYEAAPFWNADQRCGRVRRFVAGKLYPKCITIRDMKCEFAGDMWKARLRDYHACGAEIVG